jgi:hypothetical protein
MDCQFNCLFWAGVSFGGIPGSKLAACSLNPKASEAELMCEGDYCRLCFNMQKEAQERNDEAVQRVEVADATVADLREDVKTTRIALQQATVAAETAQEQVQLLRDTRLKAETEAAEMVGRLEEAEDKLRAAQAALQERRLEAEVGISAVFGQHSRALSVRLHRFECDALRCEKTISWVMVLVVWEIMSTAPRHKTHQRYHKASLMLNPCRSSPSVARCS